MRRVAWRFRSGARYFRPSVWCFRPGARPLQAWCVVLQAWCVVLQAWCEAGSGDMPLDAEPETDSELGDWLGQTSESQAHLTPSLHAPSFSVRHKPQGLDPVQEASSEGYKSSAPVGRVSAEADVMGAAYRQESSQLGPSTECAAAASLRLEARSVIGSPSCALAEV